MRGNEDGEREEENRIAVKVIDHRGNEVVVVREVG